MTTPCKLVSKFGSMDENQTQKVSRLVGELFEACSLNAQDYVNQKTIKIRTLLVASQFLGFTWEKFLQLIYTHTRIHSDVAKKLCGLEPHQENVEELLAQDFVPNDKLSKLLKRLSGQHLNRLDKIAAVDGLASMSSNKRYDCKRYLENLCYSWKADDSGSLLPATTTTTTPAAAATAAAAAEEEVSPFAKRDHVHMVRRLYDELETLLPTGERVAPYVYAVLRDCIESVTGMELSAAGEKTLSPEVMEKLKGMYLSGIGEENVRHLVKDFKIATKQPEGLVVVAETPLLLREGEDGKREGGGGGGKKRKKTDDFRSSVLASTSSKK